MSSGLERRAGRGVPEQRLAQTSPPDLPAPAQQTVECVDPATEPRPSVRPSRFPPGGIAALNRTATLVISGAVSLSASRLAARSGAIDVTPVTFPLGRARLRTS